MNLDWLAMSNFSGLGNKPSFPKKLIVIKKDSHNAERLFCSSFDYFGNIFNLLAECIEEKNFLGFFVFCNASNTYVQKQQFSELKLYGLCRIVLVYRVPKKPAYDVVARN